VLIGIRAALPNFGGETLAAITGGGQIDHVLVDMTDDLAARQDSVMLVLDDLHQIANATVTRQLGWFPEHAPSGTAMIICSRTRPAFPFARIVMGGQLIHLDAGELRFNATETAELLINRLGVDLSSRDVREITTATDGWASGTYAAGLSLRAGTRPQALLDALGESATRSASAQTLWRCSSTFSRRTCSTMSSGSSEPSIHT
jgi:ATP/maltotriose-dependent transcriptional regulator MalT